MKLILLFALALSPHLAHAGQEAKIDERIKSIASKIPDYAKWEKPALNREAAIGMPQIMFDLVTGSWNCQAPSETLLPNDHYRDQYVCASAFSKKPHERQGKYFYTVGTIVHTSSGSGSYKDGVLKSLQK